jgi:hypothetical protein
VVVKLTPGGRVAAVLAMGSVEDAGLFCLARARGSIKEGAISAPELRGLLSRRRFP